MILNSCIQNVDFDQVQEIEITPVVKSSLTFFNLDSLDFNGTNFVLDNSEFSFFDSDLAQRDVIKIELIFKINNTFNKDFNIVYQFLDEDLNEVSIVDFFSESGSNLDYVMTFEDENLIDLLKATNIIVNVDMSVNPNIITSQMRLDFKSAADVYFKIGTDE